MATSSQARVLIVGAGPVGLFMAIELARHGVAFRIIDQADKPCVHARATAIQSRTLEVFEFAGLIERFLEAGVIAHSTSTYIHGNQRLKHVSMDELDSPYPFLLCLEQCRTEQLLAEHLNRLGHQVERGVRLISFQQQDAGVDARLEQGNGPQEEQRVDYLIGCDGSHSTVRHLLGLPLEGHDFPTDFVVADVRIDWTLPGNEPCFFLSPERSLFVGPLPKGRSLLVTECGPTHHDAPPPDAPSLGQVQAHLTECGPPGVIVRDAVWLSSFRCHSRIVPRYSQGRVFLAGDAAHIQSPFGAQGMNTGIQDAANLAWKLALVLDGTGHATILDSYHAERHATGQRMLGMTDMLHKNLFLHHPSLTESIRRKLLGYLGGLEVMQHRLQRSVAELSVQYRHSPVVAEYHAGPALLRKRPDRPGLLGWRDFGAAPHAGDRVPDVRLLRWPERTPARLFQVLSGGQHHLLLLPGAEAASDGSPHLLAAAAQAYQEYGRHVQVHLVTRWPPAVTWPGNGLVLLDEQGEAHHRFGARAACLYLVRPDGYIAYRCQPVEPRRIVKYLKGIFIRDKAAWATDHIARLRRGETVQFRPWGTSMHGRIEPGQLCTLAPVVAKDLQAGDIVLCKVTGKQCLHLVKEIVDKRFLIADNLGRINGWIGSGSIYGKCVSVV